MPKKSKYNGGSDDLAIAFRKVMEESASVIKREFREDLNGFKEDIISSVDAKITSAAASTDDKIMSMSDTIVEQVDAKLKLGYLITKLKQFYGVSLAEHHSIFLFYLIVQKLIELFALPI